MTATKADHAQGLITREASPVNLEFPFQNLRERLTPTASFYVRSHFQAPELSADAHRLSVCGAVERSLELGLADLRALPQETRAVTLECAGNSRVFITPKVGGVAWELGAVSTAEWTGVPLRALLERAGLTVDAAHPGAEVILEGADTGTFEEPFPTPGEIRYARSIPLAKALDDVLLVHSMNGEPLARDHGAPLRAVVPGWYGMASVKWLQAVRVTDTPFQGFFQTLDYAYWRTDPDGLPERTALSEMQVKAQIARPAPHEALAAGQPYEVAGAAWTGSGAVERVQFSADGGQTWIDAEFSDPVEPHVWRRWRCAWTVPAQPGELRLLARATDARGHSQPQEHEALLGGYMVNFLLPIPVRVQADTPPTS